MWPSGSDLLADARRRSITALVTGTVACARVRHAVLDRAPDRGRARADRSGDPHPALRPHRDPPEDRADDHRGVGAERRDRCRARARARRGRLERRRRPIGEPGASSFVTGPRHLDGSAWRSGVVLSLVVSRPPRRSLEGVGRDRGGRSRRGRILLYRLGRRSWVSRRVPRRVSSSGNMDPALRARDAFASTSDDMHGQLVDTITRESCVILVFITRRSRNLPWSAHLGQPRRLALRRRRGRHSVCARAPDSTVVFSASFPIDAGRLDAPRGDRLPRAGRRETGVVAAALAASDGGPRRSGLSGA